MVWKIKIIWLSYKMETPSHETRSLKKHEVLKIQGIASQIINTKYILAPLMGSLFCC